MLAGSMLMDAEARWDSALYVFLFPKDNVPCQGAARAYVEHLSDTSSFCALSLEDLVAALLEHIDAEWPRELHERYLRWDKIAFE